MDEVKLALEMNKLVHNECKDVPHDIGLKLMEIVKKHAGEQLNLPPVSNAKRTCFFCNTELAEWQPEGDNVCNLCADKIKAEKHDC